MNICFITKYPPIEGGVSMRCYWLARGLAQRGHTVVVVTNSTEVEADYRIRMTEHDRAWYESAFPETGGAVIVKNSTPASERIRYIPFANPYVTKLATLAQRSIVEHDCSTIFAYYLEPYGIAAYLASQWTERPYTVRHAGSDLGRLMKDPDLHGAYREVFRRADSVSSGMREPLMAMGVDPERIWTFGSFPVPEVFTPAAEPLDLAALARDTAAEGYQPSGFRNDRAIDPAIPTIGIYGKVGPTKGSYDLLFALSALKKKGVPFNFVAVTQGTVLARFVELVRELDLEDRTWILPFVPHWRVPAFIRACTTVCFLERDFPISFHAPTIPREVLSCGTCLVVSHEIVAKQKFAEAARDGENLFTVDPTNHADLAQKLETVIRDPGRAAAVGLAGHAMHAGHVRPNAWNKLLELFERQLALPAARAARPSAAARAAVPDTSRSEALAASLPLTRAALGDRWPTLVREYCGPERVLTAEYEDAMHLAEFIRSTAVPGAPAWIDDLLRYEHAHNRLYARSGLDTGDRVEAEKTAARARQPLTSPRETQHHALDPEFLALVPLVAPGVEIHTFGHDMTELCCSLHRSDLAAPVAATPTVILFKPEPNFVGQELVINEPMHRLIDACDGTRTVSGLAELFAAQTGDDADAVVREVARMVKRLVTKGIVTFVQPAAVRAPAFAVVGQEVRS
jgi:glycosyltransferase involved in cell wall biosynthesis